MKKETSKQEQPCTLHGVRSNTFRPDVENWGLGTYIYAYVLHWCTIVGLINLGYYFFS